MPTDWTEAEDHRTVEAYFEMLASELKGEAYNKSAIRRSVLPHLNDRSHGSLELKNQNISAVLIQLGYPFIDDHTPKKHKEIDRFKRFNYIEHMSRDHRAASDMTTRDKANLDILWLKDDSLEDSVNLPPPAELPQEIVGSLEIALEEFRSVEESLATKEDS